MTESKSKREILREKRNERKRRQTITFVAISLAAILLIALAVILPRILVSRTKYDNTDGFSVGDPNAPIKVQEFTDYLCSHCKQFALYYEEDFIRTYVESGDVYFTFVNFPFMHEDSFRGAEASYCAADQNRFYEYKDFLFNYAGYAGAFSDESLISYAATAGLDTDAFEECLLTGVYAEAYINDLNYGQSVGIQGTPSFLVNGSIVSSADLIPLVESLIADLEE
jgi:protein-disulfide isomerase